MATATMPAAKHKARAVRAWRKSRKRFESFMRAYAPNDPYHWGRHTYALAALCQRATETVEAGGRFYAVFVCPYRHGKSDMVSRRYPAWHLLRNPAHEIILASYSGALASDMSYAARGCFREVAPAYVVDDAGEELPNGRAPRLSEDRQPVYAWRTTAGGGVYAVGLGGTITGRGGDVLIIDDYLKNREEAESQLIRDKIWASFTDDLMTRVAPAHAVLVPCTRWQEDDLIGRILKAGEDDPHFPQFELHRYPAWDDETGWLFPERFSADWYEAQRGALSTYAWNAQAQGDPQPRTGNLLRADMVQRYRGKEPEIVWVRSWDLASTAKERMKDDPDYTVGIREGLDPGGDLWIGRGPDGDADIIRGQWESPERNRRILAAPDSDPQGTRVIVETVAGYKDAGVEIKRALKGKAVVKLRTPNIDKVARASVLEEVFERGGVHVPYGPKGDALVAEIAAFPGKHDDQVDAMVQGYRNIPKMGSLVRTAASGRMEPGRERKRPGRDGTWDSPAEYGKLRGGKHGLHTSGRTESKFNSI